MKKILSTVFLLAIGSLQMAGDLFQQPALLAIGRATNSSPAPKVFTQQNGYETFSARFYIQYVDNEQRQHTTEITPQNYQLIKGPYNRRNMYGAAISYAPVLAQNPITQPMMHQVLEYALRHDSALLSSLGIVACDSHSIKLIIVPRSQSNQNNRFELKFNRGENHV